MDIEKLKAQLRIDEGLRLKPYIDTKDNVTIGYGHKGLDVVLDENDQISEEYAEQLLDRDINKHVNDLQIHLPWFVNLPEICQEELANMSFNMGIPTLLKFDIFLDMMKRGEYTKAADDLTHTLWHREVGGRALRIEAAFRTGATNDGQI